MLRKNDKAIALIASLSIVLLTPLQVLANPVKLEEGAPVRLKLLDTISSGTNHAGDSVSFRVVDDVMASDDKTVLIKAGTPARGSISSAQEKGFIGEKGQLSLTIEDTKSIDGKRVPLRAAVSRDGKGELGAVIALSLIICPLFLFMHGKNATMPAGAQVNAYVDRDVLVDTISVPITTASTAPTSIPTAAMTIPLVTTTPGTIPGTLNVSATVIPSSMEATATQSNTQATLVKSVEEKPEASDALDKLYESGLLTKKEYETKKKVLAKKSVALKK